MLELKGRSDLTTKAGTSLPNGERMTEILEVFFKNFFTL